MSKGKPAAESSSSSTASVPSFPPSIDLSGPREHYPFCIVWSPLPGLTSAIPFIGHVGIGDSEGKLYDFQGDYAIGKDRMLFGKVVKYVDLSREFVPSAYTDPPGSPEAIKAEIKAYDKALSDTVLRFRQCQRYDFIRNNCHNFVASALNAHPQLLALSPDATEWSLTKIMWVVATRGKYVSFSRFLQAHCISLFLLCVLMYVVYTFLR